MSNIQLYKAIARYQRMSPFKIRRVADHVRRRSYSDAIAILDNLPHKGARLLGKVLRSAAANAKQHNNQLVDEALYIEELRIDEGPRIRRVWFRGRGRADLLHKCMSHITVVVAERTHTIRKRA